MPGWQSSRNEIETFSQGQARTGEFSVALGQITPPPPARQPGQKRVHLKKPQRSGLPQNVNTCHDESWVPSKIRHQLPPGGEASPGNRAAGFLGRNPAVSTYIKAEDWVRFLGLLIRQHFGLRNVPVDSAKIYLLNSAQAHLCKSLANAGHSPAECCLISSS